MGVQRKAYACVERGRVVPNMCLRNTTAPTHLTTAKKTLLFFPHAVFNAQHADIVSVSEFENMDQMSTSMQSLRLNECAGLIIRVVGCSCQNNAHKKLFFFFKNFDRNGLKAVKDRKLIGGGG